MLMRRPDAALRAFQESARLRGGAVPPVYLAWVAAARGKTNQAIQFARLAELDPSNALTLAVVYGSLGDMSQAMYWFKRGYQSRTAGIVSIKVNPIFEPLREDPRFQAVLQEMHLL